MIVALLDAGPLIALFDTQDPYHQVFKALLSQFQFALRLHTTWPCVTKLLGARQRVGMLRWIGVGGAQVSPVDTNEVLDMSEWMLRYSSDRAEIDFADARLCRVATETGIYRIMTLAVRDFSRYSLPDGLAFELLSTKCIQ